MGQITSTNRLLFFDNLRSLMVLFVLIFHSGVSYTTMVGFWPYHDRNPSEFVEILIILFDVFMMSVLFFIAGYFALPSLQKKGGKDFLIAKFKRLGIPWLVVILSVLPVLDYFHYYSQSLEAGLQPAGYSTHWLLSMKKIAEFSIGRMSMSEYQNMTEYFYQRYMWYLSLLLLFYILLWSLYEADRKWGWFSLHLKRVDENNSSNRPVYISLAMVWIVTTVLFAIVKFIFSSASDPTDMVWFSVGNILQFQFAKLAFYIPSFSLGVYASLKRWFINGQDFGRPAIWCVLVFLLMIVNMFIGRSMTRTTEPALILQIAFLVLYPLWTLSFLCWFTALASRRWNSSYPIIRSLGLNSYNMYLVHYAFAMTLPLLLSQWETGPVLIKFLLVAITTIMSSYGISRYLLKPFPRHVVFGLFGLNFIFAFFT